jgi:thiamine kinase-like enzyme
MRLRRPFSYDSIAEIIHLMIMGYAGRTLAGQHDLDHDQLVQKAENYLQAIQKLGVLHGDPIPGNMIWNEENGRVMFIDFERATLQPRRLPLGGISLNRKRNQAIFQEKRPNTGLDCFKRETRRMRHGL